MKTSNYRVVPLPSELRAYNSKNHMIDAMVVDDQPERVIEKRLQNPRQGIFAGRSVTRGDYTFKIERI